MTLSRISKTYPRRSVARVKPKFHRSRAFRAGSLVSPFFHRIHRSVHKNRVTTDYFRFFLRSGGGDHHLQLHAAREPHLSRNLRISRRDPAFYFPVYTFLSMSDALGNST